MLFYALLANASTPEVPPLATEAGSEMACALDRLGQVIDVPEIADGEALIARGGLLYALADDGLTIARADGTTAQVLSHTSLHGYPAALWLEGDRVVVVGTAEARGATATLAVLDVSNPDNPRVTSDERIPGVLRGAELRDGQIAIVTGDGHGDDPEITSGDVLRPLGSTGCSRTITEKPWNALRVYDLDRPEEPVAEHRLDSAADFVVFGDDQVWIGSLERRTTTLTGLDLAGRPVAEIHVPGIVPSAHHLDVHDGRVTVVSFDTNDRSTTVASYSADGTLLGQLPGLGKNEVLAATRVVGPRVYVVTVDGKAMDPDDPLQAARQAMLRPKDPLFVIDVSEPMPRELGRLELPGWSDILVPIGPTTLLATGVDDKQPVVSLFDVSDPAHPALAGRVDVPKLDRRVREDLPAWTWDPASRTLALPTNRGLARIGVSDGLELIDVLPIGKGGPPVDAAFADGVLWSLAWGGDLTGSSAVPLSN